MKLIKSVRKLFISLAIFVIKRKKGLKLLSLKAKSLSGRLTFSSKLKKYLKESDTRLMQLGSGDNAMQGWFNTDLYPKQGFVFLDASKPFNIPNCTFDRIFSEHMIEHISYNQAELQLKECYRILRPGSKIRIATPNLNHYIELFSNSDSSLENYKEWISNNWLKKASIDYKNPSFFLNLVMHSWGHEFIYDFNTLETTLKGIGFTNVKEYECYQSDDNFFKGIERHGDFIGNREMNALETLVIEADKV